MQYDDNDWNWYETAVDGVRALLMLCGDVDPIHTDGTPNRMVDGLLELARRDPADITKFTTFPSTHDEMVTVQNINFVTLCAHHLLPFQGVCHVAYIPSGNLCGLSKIPRAVRYFSRGLNVQEELTTAIADFLESKLDPLGVAVVMSAEHMCMTIRGVQAAGTLTNTSAMRGVFADHSRTAKAEFMALIRP